MISHLFAAIKKAGLYVKDHPQILFVLILLILFPLLFLYTGQQFLDVGRDNQERLQKDRVGLMQDVFASLLTATEFDARIAQRELETLQSLNPDIIDYQVLKNDRGKIIPIVAKHEEQIGVVVEDDAFFKSASVRLDESIIFETYTQSARSWRTYKAVESAKGEIYFIYTELSLQEVDELFAAREQSAYISLIFVYFFVIALAIWHVRLTDYRYLYIHAKKTNETKDLFTNMIAHELRAPLTAIRGYALLLEEQLQDIEHKKYANRVRQSSERLIALVNDLLDVARIQSGKLSINREDTDIKELISFVISEMQISASQKGIELRQKEASFISAVYIDKKRFQQVLTNIVSNAIKYTKEGVIEFSLEEKQAYVEIRVQDSGMGISSENQKKLFAPFFRVGTEDVNKITGTGLGMWISKELVELMGGTIGVESIKGVGTHVVISIPKYH